MWILSPTSKPTLRHRAGCCVTPQNHFIHSRLKQFLPINELLSFFFFSHFPLLVFLKCFLHYCMHLPSSPSFILAFLKSPYISNSLLLRISVPLDLYYCCNIQCHIFGQFDFFSAFQIISAVIPDHQEGLGSFLSFSRLNFFFFFFFFYLIIQPSTSFLLAIAVCYYCVLLFPVSQDPGIRVIQYQ